MATEGRRPDRFSQKEQDMSVRRQPVRCRWFRPELDGQTDSDKKDRIRLSIVNRPLSSANLIVSPLLYGRVELTICYDLAKLTNLAGGLAEGGLVNLLVAASKLDFLHF